MKKNRLFFRRLNRGIALGLVIVLAVVLYTVITGQTFKHADKPEIEAMVKEYLSDLAAFHVGFEADTTDHTLTDAEIDARMKAFSSFMDRYFVYKKSGALYGVSAQNSEEVGESYRSYLENGGAVGEILSCSLEPREVSYGLSVSKSGPGCAVATVYVDGIIRMRNGIAGSVFCPGTYVDFSDPYIAETFSDPYIAGEYDEDGSFEASDTVFEGRCDGYMHLYFEKRDGEWKIVYAGYSYLGVYETRIVEGGAGE